MDDTVIQLGAADLDDLMALEKLCFAYHWTPEQFLMGLERGVYIILGIRSGGDLVGYLALSIIADEMEILNLAVHPDCRRKGLASRLLDHAMRMCRPLGVLKSFLDVKESNYAAMNLYKSFGYKQFGRRKKYYPDTGEDALLFRRDF